MARSWKAIERRIARFFGAERTPLSGGSSRITRSDTLHPELFIEVKSAAGKSGTNGWIYRWLESTGWYRGLVRVSRTLYAQHFTYDDIAWAEALSLDREFRNLPVQGLRLYTQTQELAISERKRPLLALVVKGKQGFWLVGQAGDLLAAYQARAAVVEARSEKDESATKAHHQGKEPGRLGADMSAGRRAS